MGKILVVDDDLTSAELLMRYLKPWTSDVDIAFSGAEALEKLQGSNYALIISDVRMPCGTGIDLLREVQNFARGRGHLPMVLTSSLGKVAQEQAQALGADGFLEKPITRESLSALMVRLLPSNETGSKQII